MFVLITVCVNCLRLGICLINCGGLLGMLNCFCYCTSIDYIFVSFVCGLVILVLCVCFCLGY